MSDHSDINERADKAAARQARAASAAKRRKRIERAGYNVSEFSASLGIDPATTFRWIKKGVVRAVQIGGLTIITAAELDRLLAEGAPARRGRQSRAATGHFLKGAPP
jgi:hypothetical protein